LDEGKDMQDKSDYLIVGSGLAGLTFGALMAHSGKRVTVLEAHYHAGGFGHTFDLGGHKFNAQLHYVWNCGEGQTVHNVLKRLGLAETVTFERYAGEGFDHMRMPGYSLDIPNDYEILITRLSELFPTHERQIRAFLEDVRDYSAAVDDLPSISPITPATVAELIAKLPMAPRFWKLYQFSNLTLQEVFDRYGLPPAAQTLLALQWPDFMLPPEDLSFIAWMMLFSGYMQGAYYPTHHFEHVIDSLVGVIEGAGGRVLLEHKAVAFLHTRGRMTGVVAERLDSTNLKVQFDANTVICNMDPRRAAEMIGFEHFRPTVQKKLNYAYSPSNFMVYAAVKDINLAEHGFGKWNLFHTEEPDLNRAFDCMYNYADYSRPSFAVTAPGFLTSDKTDVPEGHQIIEMLTVANYTHFLDLRLRSPAAYRKQKQIILDRLLDVIEAHYIPNLRDHMVMTSTGSPTTNERYCWAPMGNSYGSNMIPENMGIGRLNHETSIDGFYFCNASSGYAGFSGTFWTGATLFEHLTGEKVLR
jgi:all-trans-retinol 13,14-reductase